MNDTLDFTNLRGPVGTRHPQLGAMIQEEGPGGRIVELTLIIALEMNCRTHAHYRIGWF
jgi:hypothetical protein